MLYFPEPDWRVDHSGEPACGPIAVGGTLPGFSGRTQVRRASQPHPILRLCRARAGSACCHGRGFPAFCGFSHTIGRAVGRRRSPIRGPITAYRWAITRRATAMGRCQDHSAGPNPRAGQLPVAHYQRNYFFTLTFLCKDYYHTTNSRGTGVAFYLAGRVPLVRRPDKDEDQRYVNKNN